MSHNAKQRAGEIVHIYGLPHPVTSVDDYQAAQLVVLTEIRDELRRLNATDSAQAAPPRPVATPAPEPEAAAAPSQPKAPARGRRRSK